MFNRYSRSHYVPRFGQPSWNTVRARRANPTPLKTYSAEQVFAAAVAAQETNGEYVKQEQRDPETNAVTVRTNKELMREFLEQELTDAQRAQGQQIRNHYQKLLFRQMTGELKDFLATALRVSTKEEFANNDWLDLAIVASLPSCYQRDVAREMAQNQLQQMSSASQTVGTVGERITGEFEIVQSHWSQKWNLWTINARRGNDLFFFFNHTQLTPGQTVALAGTIKGYRDGNITQLNRVKLTKQK